MHLARAEASPVHVRGWELPLTRFLVGLDLGQAQDFTALVVLERDGDGYQLRHAERFRGRAYPDVVSHVVTLLGRPPLAGASTLAVDGTGVGVAVVDLFRRAPLLARLVPISIHGGSVVTEDASGISVPKRDLALVLHLLLGTGRLRIARGLPHARTLAEELINFVVTVSPTGHESFAARRAGDHDDLVLAVALAAWTGERS